MKLFQYAIIKHPTEKEAESGKPSELVVPITTVLAKDLQQAAMLAGRSIPDPELAHLDRLEVAVRPF